MLSGKFKLFAVLVLLVNVCVLGAQAPAPAQTPNLRGRVLDSSGAVMPGADVKVFQGTNLVREGKANESGDFALDVPAGNYRLEVSFPDFNPHREEISVGPNMTPLSVSLTLGVIATNVEVTASSAELSLDEGSSLTSTTISGEALEDLPDNEEDLAAYLQQLAGGTGGEATFVIDGFNGGRLPPRDQIQQIIINNNPFGAEGRGGGPRIQIIRRPGSGEWRGGFQASFRDESLNAKNPFALDKPSSQNRTFSWNMDMPLIPNILGMNFRVSSNETESEGESLRAVTPNGFVDRGVVSPNIRRGLETRGNLFLSQRNTLNFGFSYDTNKQENQGVGGFNLPERASNRRGNGWNFQVSETMIFSPTMTNESRFEFRRSSSNQTPVTEGLAINVLDAFFGGGGQNRSENDDTTYQFGNTLRWQVGQKWNFQLGTEGDYNKSHSVSENNFLGTFVFSSLDDYIAGRPTTFTQNSGDPVLDVSQFEMSAFFQANWNATQKSNLGFGLRYQAQTNLDDYNNFAPTLSFAYRLTPTTVFRTGARISYQGFGMNNVEQLLRNDGTTRQFQTVILNPSYPDPFAGGTGTTTGVNNSSKRTIAEDFVSPYNINSSVGFDQQLPRNFRFGAEFNVNRGVHQLRTRNINAPYPGTALDTELLSRLNSRDSSVRAAARTEVDMLRPLYPYVGNVNQFESIGSSISKNINFRMMIPNLQVSFLNFGGFMNYTNSWGEDDNGTPMNHYDRAAEWARSSNGRHRIQGNMRLGLPWQTNMGFNFSANSGSFYTITTGRDENGDTSTNDRPAGLGRNTAVGPRNYNVDMNFGKVFTLSRGEQPQGNAANAFPQQGGFGGGNPGGGGGGQRGGDFGRGGGGFGGGSGPTLRFNISVRNLLNNTQLRNYSGVMTSPFFGRATNAQAGRSVILSLNMDF